MDFSKLTLHQAKRAEMEAQVRVLELESKVEKERRRLADLRKKHYQLGGESEGWEQEVTKKNYHIYSDQTIISLLKPNKDRIIYTKQ